MDETRGRRLTEPTAGPGAGVGRMLNVPNEGA